MNSLLCLALFATLAYQATARSADNNYYNLFGIDIYREVRKINDGNFAVCPLSAQIVLALVSAGAGGKTAQELSSALHLPEDKEQVQKIFTELSPDLQGNDIFNLSSANKVYVKKGYHVKDTYKKVAEDVFHAEIQDIDFEQKKEAVNEMNEWVEEKTHDNIKNLISEDDIDEDTRSVLINAMYFQANWTEQFYKEFTQKKPFHVNSKDEKEVEMMQQTDYFNYFESKELNTKFLEMKYKGGDITMTFVLPNAVEGLEALEEKIKDVFIDPDYENRKVYVQIPKFTIESKIDFTTILQNLGVHEAFTDSANFHDILVEDPLKISKVLQKTFIEVTEGGTTAAAATYVIAPIAISAPFPDPIPIAQFNADHPFLYYIKIKDVMFFVGRFVSP